jgi:CRP/FNR family transcriptional regulator, cyclic AMP receptor protein
MARHHHLASLLDVDPDLGGGLDERNRLEARRRLVAPVVALESGRWDASRLEPPGGDALGLLIADGLVLRDVAVVQSMCAELLGTGDIIRPWQDIGVGAVMATEVEWRSLSTTTLLVVDRRLMAAMAPWPEITMALVSRTVARAQTLAVALAISCIRGLEIRLLALLWHLADQFGRVRREGVVLELPLTHQVIGRLAGATRPSVSTALKTLENDGRISRLERGGFVLHGDPPDLATLLVDRRRATAEHG